jgi:hypothetical protein
MMGHGTDSTIGKDIMMEYAKWRKGLLEYGSTFYLNAVQSAPIILSPICSCLATL